MSDTRFAVVVIAAIIGLIAVTFGIAYGLTAYQCAAYERVTGRPTKMAAGSCYIKDGNQWFPWEEYKLRGVTKGQ